MLFKQGPDQIIRRCVPEDEMEQILEQCHSSPYGSHFGAVKTASKVLQSGFYLPTLLSLNVIGANVVVISPIEMKCR